MKRIVFVGMVVALCPRGAQAKPAKDGDNFWASLIAPHADEIAVVLKHARELRTAAMGYTTGVDLGWDNPTNEVQREQRRRRIADAYGMLRYAARELDPKHPEILFEVARAAGDLGYHDAARAALESFIEIADDNDKRLPQVRIRLGRVHARLGEWDDAALQFRMALSGHNTGLHGQALIYLGCAYMHANRMAETIDALDQATHTSPYGQSYYYVSQTAQFALAVAYDRDEQITRSHEVLEKLLSMDASLSYAFGQPDYGYSGGMDTEPLLEPPYERHYFMAFRYEAMNQLDEARAEWRAYIRAADDSPFRDRARAHVDAIDALHDEQMRASKDKP